MRTSRRRFLKHASAAPLATLAALDTAAATTPQPATATTSRSGGGRAKSKRDLMMDVLDRSRTPSYVPAGFFMHFGVTGDAAVKAHLDYFRATGMDFVKIQFDEQQFARNELIRTPKDWASFPVLPEKWFEPSLHLLRQLVKAAKSEALIIQTLYTPYQMAKQAVPWELLVEHVKQDAEAVSRGMENITLSLMNFVDAAARAGADGFYLPTQGGETNRIADRALFNRAIKAHDMFLHKRANELTPCNLLHVCDYDGTYADFESKFRDYPGQVVTIPLEADGKPLSLSRAAAIFGRPVMGGLDRHGVLQKGTPDEVKRAAAAVLKDAPAHVILGANCTVDAKTPMANLKAAIDTAHAYRA
jgi:uroporphyrinogen decarboxylase